jgi:hypothetical protein
VSAFTVGAGMLAVALILVAHDDRDAARPRARARLTTTL